MKNTYYFSVYDVSSMLYAGELAKPSKGVFNFASISQNVDGIPIGGVRYLLRSVVFDLYQRTGTVLVFDSKTDKQKLFADYKSTRQRNPSIYVQQLMMLDVVKQLGIPYMKVEGYEADDLVHAVIKKYSPIANNISIYSGDTDLAANLIRDRITLRGTASIYPTFDKDNYELNIKKGCNIPYNSVLAYYAIFGKKSNNVPPIGATKVCEETFKKFTTFCTAANIPQAHWSFKATFYQWLQDCLSKQTLEESMIGTLFDRVNYVFPKDYDGAVPENIISLDDIDKEKLAFYLKTFNMGQTLIKLGMDEVSYAPRTPEMLQFIREYKEVFQNGCLAVDNDMPADDSIFNAQMSDLIDGTSVFGAEDF